MGTTLPQHIEIFRPGRHIDDAGGVHEFSAADVADMAAVYDPALREAPLVVGHPRSNLPAYGWVQSLQINADGRLTMSPRDVEPQFAEMVEQRRFPKRSASFYPPGSPNNPTPGKWYLRHVGFLGAQPPAIAGLKDIQFADGDAGAISFSEAGGDPGRNPQEQQRMDKEEKERLEAQAKADREAREAAEEEARKANEKLAQFAEQQRQDRHAGFVAFAEEQLQAGRLLPRDKEAAVAVLDLLAEAQPVEFAEGGAQKKLAPADWLKGLIAAATPAVSFGEFAPGSAGTGNGAPGAQGLSDAEIDRRAKTYAKQHKVSYAEALHQVVSFTA